ncbi:MAG: cellulase family glycosylhydrolase [Spirochaetia bacterium]|nr:cellulase family glycosylhydrolase [Spirochaetia bacterium]
MKKVLDTGADIVAVGHWLAVLFLDLAELQKTMEPQYDQYVPYKVNYADLADKNHPSWALTVRYYQQLIGRYKNNPQIVAWEFPNELNLLADIPNRTAPGSSVYAPTNEKGPFKTDMLIEYSRNLTELIRSVDPNHLVFTGNATPRPSAWHLWKEGNFTRDSVQELESYLKETHAIPGLGAWSIHFYNDKTKGIPDSERFGYQGADLLKEYARIARDVVKRPMFIGETGDSEPTIEEQNGEGVFMSRVLEQSYQLRIPITLLWAWYPTLTSKDQDRRRLEKYPKVRQMAKDFQARFDLLKE